MGVPTSLLDGRKEIDVGLEDPLDPSNPNACVDWPVNAIVSPPEDSGESSAEESSDGEDLTSPAKRRRSANKPSAAVFRWVGSFYDDEGVVWRVESVEYDDVQGCYVVRSIRADPPPPPESERDADDSWWNWAEVPRFRFSFASKLRKNKVKHSRAPSTPKLRLTYSIDRYGGDLAIGAYWRSMTVSDLGGKGLTRA